MKPQPPRFTADQAVHAAETWGCNCGPAALAAVTGLTLDQVRPHMEAVGFARRLYTNPTMMVGALCSIGARFSRRPASCWPAHGLVRVQWEGPWTRPGVPIKARYRYTHWIGAALHRDETGVFDVNILGNGSGWTLLEHWEREVVPMLSALYPEASGGWHKTHCLEVES